MQGSDAEAPVAVVAKLRHPSAVRNAVTSPDSVGDWAISALMASVSSAGVTADTSPAREARFVAFSLMTSEPFPVDRLKPTSMAVAKSARPLAAKALVIAMGMSPDSVAGVGAVRMTVGLAS
ncbi:hypothetical protein [Methylobacterium sp. R2-1]|uniref:hypothetical protein n=1 Tax=Methylobacterium sp. R2-1 TaxID=2587064 RepID=UPI0018490AC7|nr:hypothetical protein [Methylobacterium sp. R2-1]MBB2961891.1 hypothetical protein [Methylobacterium sp. R2-1]